MNKKQRIVVLIGTVLAVLSGLFPPYEGEFRREGEVLTKYMGNYFLFAPPTEGEVYQAILGRTPSGTISPGRFNSHIVASRLWIQIFIILIATIGLALLLGGKLKQRSFNKLSAGDGL